MYYIPICPKKYPDQTTSEQVLSPEEQERLVSIIKNPGDSVYILGFCDAHGKKLTQSQSEKLLNENEILWLKRLQEIIDKD